MRFPLFYGTIVLFLFYFFGIEIQAQEKPFYPNGTYQPEIPSPEQFLGFPLGSRPVRYEEVSRYFQLLAEKSPKRTRLIQAGQTHEKRNLFYLIVSAEKNIEQLEQIRHNISLLADPRLLKTEAEAEKIIEENPSVVWLMYSIHGDELSGTDSSLQIAYQLVAGTDSVTEALRRDLLVGIDPLENPDGRERFLSQMQQWTGNVPNSDPQSIHHTSVWPWGRTNHYFFDLNRDWCILAHPETEARVKAVLDWKPQFVVDAHEMGSDDTFVFNPPREPINHNLNPLIQKWWKIFSADQAKAFDSYGWSYYTREWLEEWYPGYGSSWPSYTGAIGFLYEQARTEGSLVKRPDGSNLTFREAVHHQFTAAVANLTTAMNHRKVLLQDYYTMKKEALSIEETGLQAFYVVPGENHSRVHRLMECLLKQGIEIEVLEKEVRVKNIKSYWESQVLPEKTLPSGTYVIRLQQPLRPLVQAILEFDPRLSNEYLKEERDSLEKGYGTRLYEASAWSLLIAYDVEAYHATLPLVFETKKITLNQISLQTAEVHNPSPTYGFVIEGQEDQSILMLLRLFEEGYKVRVAREDFQIQERAFLRGSFLLRCHENPASLSTRIPELARQCKISVYGANSALTQNGPDLGGNDFQLLTAPKVAILTGHPVDMYQFGTLWYLFDQQWKYRCTLLHLSEFEQADLRKYNVLILPSTWDNATEYRRFLQEEDLTKIKEWVTQGGTLIAIKHGAAFLADSETKISEVKLRRQVLKEVPLYDKAVEEEEKIGRTAIVPELIWEEIESEVKSDTVELDEREETELERIDSYQRTFMPRGTILRVELNSGHWLTFGGKSEVPAMIESDYVFLSRPSVETAGRFASAKKLRISGLLWPEARARWAKSAYLTREEYGKGQIILFAGDPSFRAYFHGTIRLFFNSVAFGPGFGTKVAQEW